MKKLSILFALILVLSLCACGGNNTPATEGESTSEPTVAAPQIADLTGQWTQVSAGGRFQGAMISGSSMKLFWISNNGETIVQSWEGSFTAPTTADEPYTWESKSAKDDATITFAYADGRITFTEPEVGSTIILEKNEWAPGKGIEDDVTTPVETLPGDGPIYEGGFGGDGDSDENPNPDDDPLLDAPEDDYHGDMGEDDGGITDDNGGSGVVDDSSETN